MRSLRHTIPIVLLYLVTYFVASGLDLWSTGLALRRAGVTEGNAFATEQGIYRPMRAWVITGVGALAMGACVIFAFRKTNSVSDESSLHPARSFRKLYVIPWSKAVMDRSPLHALSYAFGFVALRLLAAGKNLLISAFGVAPLGSLVKAVTTWTSPVVGLFVVTGGLYLLLTVAVAPLAARVILWQRRPS